MSYDLTRITGKSRTFAPVVPAGSVSSRREAAALGAAHGRRNPEDCADFRAVRSLMAQSFGLCG